MYSGAVLQSSSYPLKIVFPVCLSANSRRCSMQSLRRDATSSAFCPANIRVAAHEPESSFRQQALHRPHKNRLPAPEGRTAHDVLTEKMQPAVFTKDMFIPGEAWCAKAGPRSIGKKAGRQMFREVDARGQPYSVGVWLGKRASISSTRIPSGAWITSNPSARATDNISARLSNAAPSLARRTVKSRWAQPRPGNRRLRP